MEDRLQDFSPASLVNAIENNLSSWIPVLGLIGESRFNDPPGINRCVSSIALPFFNSIMDARLNPEDVDRTIQLIKTDAEKRHVPVLWWIGPSTRPPELGQQLQSKGFSIDDDEPGMAVDFAMMNENLPMQKGLTIRAVSDDIGCREWAATLAAGFEIPMNKVDYLLESWQKLMRLASEEVVLAFLARLHGKPVATSLLLLGGGAAGIYAVSTIPAARRQGVGAQVTIQPLRYARQNGYKIGVLQASDMGHPVYQAIGFKDYCRITSYVYRPNR
jgi:GNAT superfamily N-acetyltransferase